MPVVVGVRGGALAQREAAPAAGCVGALAAAHAGVEPDGGRHLAFARVDLAVDGVGRAACAAHVPGAVRAVTNRGSKEETL